MLVNLKILTFLGIGYLVYLIVGASIFFSIEEPLERERCANAKSYIKSLFKDFNGTSFQNKNLTMDELEDIVQTITTYRGHGIRFRNASALCPDYWTFQGSFLFAGTIITTIGYGHVTPTTEASRLVCIFYALIGIPIFAILFVGLGQIFSQSFQKISEFLNKLDLKERWKNLLLLTTFAGTGFALFSLFPAIIFHFYEGWSYLDSIYFTIITLTTIGFGDFVAGGNPAIDYFTVYKIMVYFWILFGLAFMATFINLLSDRFKTKATDIVNRVSKDRRTGNMNAATTTREEEAIGEEENWLPDEEKPDEPPENRTHEELLDES